MDYEKIVSVADKMADLLSEVLSNVAPYSPTDSSVYHSLKQMHIDLLKKNKILPEKYKALVEKAIELTSQEVHKLENIPPYSPIQQKRFFSLFQTNLSGLIAQSESDSASNEKITFKTTQRASTTYAVFLSHANTDRKIANLIKKLLEEFDVTSFVAHDDIREGDVWEPTLIDAVKNSKIMIVIGTTEIEKSPWVNFETGLAYDNMFPVIFEKLTDKVSYIKNKQGIVIVYDDLDASLVRLVKTVLLKLGLTTKRTDEELKSLSSFKKLKEFILATYRSSKEYSES